MPALVTLPPEGPIVDDTMGTAPPAFHAPNTVTNPWFAEPELAQTRGWFTVRSYCPEVHHGFTATSPAHQEVWEGSQPLRWKLPCRTCCPLLRSVKPTVVSLASQRYQVLKRVMNASRSSVKDEVPVVPQAAVLTVFSNCASFSPQLAVTLACEVACATVMVTGSVPATAPGGTRKST